MFQQIKAFFGEEQAKLAHDPEARQIAVAALLIEAALMDQQFEAVERDLISKLLMARFDLTPENCEALLEIAAKKVDGSLQLYGFTSVIKNEFEPEERRELVEMLWQVVYADGKLGDYEANLMRRVAGLIFVSDRESGAARKRALARLGLEG